MTKLLLFDIDGTLVLTGGAGARAMIRAFGDVFGIYDGFDRVPMAGRTDAWIVAQITALHGIDCHPEGLRHFRESYLQYLPGEIRQPGPRKGIMPGVRDLLDALAPRDDVFLALLTGNFEQGARVKLEYFDLWRYFRCGAFGDTAHERNGLLAEVLGRAAVCGASGIGPRDTFVIGDTPFDVAVAASGGARSIAVATGGHGVDALAASGADVVFQDLGDLAAVLNALQLEERLE